MTRLAYAEFPHWNAILGCKAVRLSVADERGQEFFMLVPKPDREWREEKAKLLDLIAEAIESGCQPGEVVLCSEPA
jgi:hypothetical protein